MRSAVRFPALIAIVLSARLLAAQSADPLTLDEALARALKQNPDLRIARLRVDSSRAEVRIARAYSNPTLSVAPNNPWQYSVSAPLDVGPQRTYRVRAAADGALASAHDTHDTERTVRFAVRAAFFDLLLADTIRAITREQHNVFRDLLTADSARVGAGDIPERNLLKSELELAKSDADLSRADAAVRAARLALQLAMGTERPDTGLRVVGSLIMRPRDPVAALPTAFYGPDDSTIARRPDVQAARVRTQASEDARRFARSLLVPVPELMLVQQRDEPFANGQHYAVGVGAQLPVWNWFAGERERADASVEQSRVMEARTRVQATTEIAAALDQLHAAEQLARKLDAGLLEKARVSLETARFAYSSGAISYVEFLDAVHTDTQIRADAATAAHDYWVSAYAVVRAIGTEEVK
jgi:cobalt-zinc-cadmium efflux system outer membrane protein